jgi:hypothetical protein
MNILTIWLAVLFAFSFFAYLSFSLICEDVVAWALTPPEKEKEQELLFQFSPRTLEEKASEPGDVAAEVEAVRQATAGELGDEGEQREGQSG